MEEMTHQLQMQEEHHVKVCQERSCQGVSRKGRRSERTRTRKKVDQSTEMERLTHQWQLQDQRYAKYANPPEKKTTKERTYSVNRKSVSQRLLASQDS